VVADPLSVQQAVDEYKTQAQAEFLRRDLREFVAAAWPQVEPKPFKNNWHLDAICDHLAYVTFGDIRNLMINIPPRQTKSLVGSVIWPVWEWLLDPRVQFLFASYAQDLAIRDAVKSRRLIESAWFRERFSKTFYLDPADNRKHRYVNNLGGHRISTSVGGKTTGEGGDKIVIDDPHNMADVYSDAKRHSALSWWDNSMRSRLNDPRTGQKVLIGQRSHDADLFGHILNTEDERWEVLMLPMEYDPARHCVTFFNKGRGHRTKKGSIFEDPRNIKGDLLNPNRFGMEEKKAESKAMSPRDYSAQFNQDPTSGGGLILKKKWWQQWCFPQDHPQAGKPMPYPEFFEIISVYDTAFEEDEEADFSARISAGLFEWSDTGRDIDMKVHAMLLERMNERYEFPDLKVEAVAHNVEMSPDRTLIEKKASGHSLIQELRKAGISVWPVNPGTKDKVFRAHMVSQILKEGRLHYIPRNWAYEVINQCATFPVGENDDLVDCIVMLLAYIRRMGIIELDDDEKDDEMKLFAQPRKFYGA
jgi:predicted phage terminase large subunit-like protein